MQRNTLLATRLHIPHPRLDLVPRPRLTHRLNEGATRKLTLITAPAGFGKTTLPFLVILPSLLALVSAVLLLWIRPASVPLWSAVLVMVLDLAVLISTAVWQAPLHEKLDRKGFSTEVIDTLVKSNWIRTALWTTNALLLLGMTATALLAAR